MFPHPLTILTTFLFICPKSSLFSFINTTKSSFLNTTQYLNSKTHQLVSYTRAVMLPYFGWKQVILHMLRLCFPSWLHHTSDSQSPVMNSYLQVLLYTSCFRIQWAFCFQSLSELSQTFSSWLSALPWWQTSSWASFFFLTWASLYWFSSDLSNHPPSSACL